MADGDFNGSVRYLAVQTNSDGRPCCWAKAKTEKAARKQAQALWPKHGGSGHGCYPGEERGELIVHVVHE